MQIQRILQLAKLHLQEPHLGQIFLSANEAMVDVSNYAYHQRNFAEMLDEQLKNKTFSPSLNADIDTRFVSANRLLFNIGCILASMLMKKGINDPCLKF